MNKPEFTGTPMPKDEPLAPNPPAGAIVDYAFPANFTGDGADRDLRSVRGVGETVRQRGSAKAARPLEATGRPRMGDTRAAACSATPGHHRFVWDLHYAKPAGIEGEQELESGPLPASIPSSSRPRGTRSGSR